MNKHWHVLMVLFFLSACTNSPSKEVTNVDLIIERAIDSSGTKKFEKAIVAFQFRDKTYKSIPTCNGLKLQRRFMKDSIQIQDQLYQGEFSRTENETPIQVNDSLANLYAESVNSVHYFTQLPFRLNDEAVQKEWVGMENAEEIAHYKLKVWFKEEGGGQDFEDVYYYWLDSDSYQIMYLAYSFKVNGGGIRFRKAIEQKAVNGIRFNQYENYQPDFENASVSNSLKDFLDGKYKLLSTIETSAILVDEIDLNCN